VSTRCSVVVAILASFVVASAGAAEARVPLVWTDPAGAAVGLDAVAREEARSLLERMGVAVAWRRENAGSLARAGEVRVILLDRGAERGPGKPVLGATPPRFEVGPFVWVHVPNVRAAIGLSPRGPVASIEAPMARALGIAIGRVVAHEVVHALAPAVPHGRGLMSASLGRSQLTASSIAIEESVLLSVQAALRGDPLLPRSEPGAMAAAVDGEDLRR
jgi:hypothetical protein